MIPSENEQAWQANKAKWKADAGAELLEPIVDIHPVMGQVSDQRGSWALYLEDRHRTLAVIEEGCLFVHLFPMQISAIWALPAGQYYYGGLVDYENRAVRFVIERNAPAVSSEGD